MIGLTGRRANESLISIWWFAVLAIIGVSIAGGVALFASSEIDANYLEAETLAVRILNCLDNDISRQINISNKDYDFLESCGLDKNQFTADGKASLMIKISDDNKILKEIKSGNPSYYADCDIVLSGSFKFSKNSYPGCFANSYSISDNTGRRIRAEILTAVNYEGGWRNR